MKQKAKIVQKDVTYLTKPRAEWVSVVNKGANQTPFNVLKSEKGVRMAKVKKSRIKLVKKGAVPTSVRKLVFDKAEFPNEAEVKKFLDTNKWEDYKITAKGETFEAAGEDVTDENFTSIKAVPVAKGITGYVGVVKMDTIEDDDAEVAAKKAADEAAALKAKKKKPDAEDAADGADDEGAEAKKAKKVIESVRKYDYWNAYLSGDESLAGVLKDGMSDGMPPGIGEVMQAVYTATANALKSDQTGKKKKSLVEKIGSDFAAIVLATADAYNELVAAEDTTKAEKDYIAKVDEFVAKHADESANQDLTNGNPALKAIAATLENVAKALAGLGTKVDGVAAVAEEAKTLATKSSEDTAALGAAAPTKKGSGVDAVNGDSTVHKDEKARKESEKDAEFRRKMAANALGTY